MSDSLPVLYSFRRCPYAMRARLALRISGVKVEIREIVLRAKPQSMLDASPKGTVPVLILPNGEVVDQSLDIMLWALGNGDPEGWLERNDAALIARCDGAFKHDLDRYKYPNRHDSDPLMHRAQGLDFLQVLEIRCATQGQLAGSKRGLADLAIMPFVRQFAATDEAWFSQQDIPHVRAWLADHLQSQLFMDIMPRLTPWAEGDEPLYFGG